MTPDAPTARIRTFHGRHGRTTDRMRDVLDRSGVRRGLGARPDRGRPVVLEVGCGHGEAALGYAARHRDHDVVATDVHTPGIAHLLERADEARLDNLYAERADALDLLDGLLAGIPLAGVHLFFPDPWPKRRHHKRRFIRPDVLDLLADRMAPGAALLVATDVAAYARWATDHLDGHPEFRGGPVERPEWRPVTRYEHAAQAAGRKITELRYERR